MTKTGKTKRSYAPLLSWDIIALMRSDRQRQLELSPLYKLKELFQWQINLDQLVQHYYQAIVVTDPHQNIEWASKGFEQMTGYRPSDVIGKSPSFLQGELTSKETRVIIRDHLVLRKPVAASLLNYRQNGETYLCSVDIRPIFNEKNVLTHFIALESEIETIK